MKKITVILVILSVSCTQSIAQRWNLVNKNSVDLVFGGDLGFRFLDTKSQELEIQERMRNRNRRESTKSNCRIGFNYNFALTDRLFLKSGLRLTNPGYIASRIDTTIYKEGVDLGFFSAVKKYNYNYYFLEMPMMVRYVYSENWCKSYIEGGFSANYYLGTQIKAIDGDGTVDVLKIKEDINPVNLSAIVSIGAEFEIAKKIPAFIQLIYRYQFSELENNQIQEHYWSAGFEAGIRYGF